MMETALTNPTKRYSSRVELAADLYRQFHTLCFWYGPANLVVEERHIPFIARELAEEGGVRGKEAALRLTTFDPQCH